MVSEQTTFREAFRWAAFFCVGALGIGLVYLIGPPLNADEEQAITFLKGLVLIGTLVAMARIGRSWL